MLKLNSILNCPSSTDPYPLQLSEEDRLLLARFQQYEQSQELLSHALQYWDRAKGLVYTAPPPEAPPPELQDSIPGPPPPRPARRAGRRKRRRESGWRERGRD